MVRQTATVITLELIGGILLLAVASVAILAFMLARGPVELNMFSADVERALEEARDGRDVEIGSLSLRWSPSERQMIVAADDLTLADEQGEIAGRADEAIITLDAGSLLFGRTEVQKTELRNGWVDVTRLSPTQWTFAGEPLPPFEARSLPTTVEGWLELSNRVFGQILQGLEQTRAAGPLQSASFSGMTLRFKTGEGDLIGEMSNASGAFERLDGGLSVSLNGGGSGLGLPGDLEASLRIPNGFTQLALTVGVEEWSIGDLADRLGMESETVDGFPADIGFGLSYAKEAGITRLTFTADAGAGEIELKNGSFDIESLKLDTAYSPAENLLQITTLDIASKRFRGALSGQLTNPAVTGAEIPFVLRAPQIELDLSPYFPEAWVFPEVELEGVLPPSFDTIKLDAFAFGIGSSKLEGEGEISLAGDDAEGGFPLAADLEAELEGRLDVDDVLDYWPETLGAGARNFAKKRIESGTVTAATVDLSLKPDSFTEGYLRDEDLEVRFFIENGAVRFLSDLPPVTKGVGSGRLTGNGFSVALTSGEFGGWQLTEGSVTFPRFNPKGEDFRVFAKGEGPAVGLMRAISESRLKLEERTGFDPERVSGTARLTFEMFRPMLSDVPMEDIDLSVSGTLTDGGLDNVLPGLDLEDARADILLEDQLLVITGFGDVGPAPVQFTWRDALDDEDEPANLSASAFITPDFLNRFGFVGRAYVSGEIPVELQAQVSGDGPEALEIGFELEQTRIDVSEIGWIKPAGERARATLSYDGGANSSASTFQFQSEDAVFDGDIQLSNDGRLQLLDVRRVYLADFIDAGGEIRRADDDGFVASLSGPFLDASAFFGDLGAVGDEAGSLQVPVLLEAELETLRLREGLDLRSATLDFESTRSGVREVIARGEIGGSGQGNLFASYVGPSVDDPARIRLESDDAGFFMRGLLGQDFLSGGTLNLEGDLARGNEPARFDLSLENVRMREAPFLTQVLSLASLRGLADTLSGEGVLFTKIEVPIAIAGNRIVIEGARANGPALGLTLNGWFDQASDDIRLSGVLVPSFGVNSMLGGVPIIGDLFVGREGEGIFSLTYSVRGTLNKAQVAINPLSAVTPGVLRRIFENPADTSIPDSLPVDPDLTPPAPPMPDAEFIPSAPG